MDFGCHLKSNNTGSTVITQNNTYFESYELNTGPRRVLQAGSGSNTTVSPTRNSLIPLYRKLALVLSKVFEINAT